jgi:hypothetical protein
MSVYSFKKAGRVLDTKALNVEQLHELTSSLAKRVNAGIYVKVSWNDFEFEGELYGKEAEDIVHLPDLYRMVGEKFAQRNQE